MTTTTAAAATTATAATKAPKLKRKMAKTHHCYTVSQSLAKLPRQFYQNLSQNKS